MKSTLTFNNGKEIKTTYPVLKQMVPGRASGSEPDAVLVVMFTDEKRGVVVHSNLETSPVGQDATWIECMDKDCWVDFDGKVVLSNG